MRDPVIFNPVKNRYETMQGEGMFVTVRIYRALDGDTGVHDAAVNFIDGRFGIRRASYSVPGILPADPQGDLIALTADSALKPAAIPIINRPPFRFEAGHHSNQ
jgi:hypothetical protein